MGNKYLFPALLLLCASALASTPAGTTVVDDTFANGDSQHQDLANNSLWLFNGRANNLRTDQVGSVTFDVTPAGTSSEAFWAYFTNAGSPIVLGVGDKLSVSVTFSLSGFLANGQDVRFGVFDSLGTRNTTNLTGGQNDSTFINDTGYALDFYASGAGSAFVIGRRTVLSNANVFNSFGDFSPIPGTGADDRQTLADNIPYTLTYTIERLTAADTRISTAVTGSALSPLNYSAVETTSSPNTSFDYFAFRIGGTNFTAKITFTELLVQYTPAAPVITSQPQPSSLTVQVGSKVTMAVGAGGSNLTYQWQKDGKPVVGNPSATTPTLSLSNVQHSDAGAYTAVISNAGGSVSSNPVTLNVSDTPVPPPPAITTQPSNTTVTLGKSTSLSVAATGDRLFYQWFKNGVLIPGATAAQLTFQNAQVGDAASYSVVVSNSSGSISSASGTLLVVSPMSADRFAPSGGRSGVCVDAPLSIRFDQTPQTGKTGRIRVYNSQGTLMDTVDMAANPQSRVIGGNPYTYYPVMVDDTSASIYLHQQLPYNDSYYVTMEPGVIVDASGAPFAGFSDVSLWTFKTRAAGPADGASALTVDAAGSGDFCTVQGAIDFVPVNNTQPVTITVRAGTYTEIDYVASNKPFITVRGEDREDSIIQYPNNNSINPSTSSRAMFGVDASDFTLENITLWNTTPHGGSQAEAFRGNNQRILLNRVNLQSFQDTLLLQGAGFVTDSFIEGDVDFLWGVGSVYFQNCELKAATSGGYYTQIRNGQGQPGYVFVNSRLSSEDNVTGMYLARIDPTVFPYSQVVYINTAMGPHIIPAGWLLNNANTAPNAQFWEYKSTDLTGAPLDVSQRASFSRQITSQEAAQWSDPAFVLGGWVPFTVNAAAGSVSPGAAVTVNWSGAVGHAAKDWVGLYAAGDPDTNFLAWQYTGPATTGHLSFAAPGRAGQYEFRYFLNDGFRRAAAGNRVSVQ
jgi:pectin methylesterase-like acyl-CoA thioesterase